MSDADDDVYENHRRSIWSNGTANTISTTVFIFLGGIWISLVIYTRTYFLFVTLIGAKFVCRGNPIVLSFAAFPFVIYERPLSNTTLVAAWVAMLTVEYYRYSVNRPTPVRRVAVLSNDRIVTSQPGEWVNGAPYHATENRIARLMVEMGLVFRREVVFESLPGARFDFVGEEFILEFDGNQHFQETAIFHRRPNAFATQRETDVRKTAFGLTVRRKFIRMSWESIRLADDNHIKAMIQHMLDSRFQLHCSEGPYQWIETDPRVRGASAWSP